MSKAKSNKLAHRHIKYALLAYAIVAMLLIAAILRPSQIFMWASVVIVLVTLFITRYHTKQGQLHKDTLLEYILVLVATLVVLLGAIRH